MRPVPATAFPFAHRARGPGVQGIALSGFWSPQFSKGCRKNFFLKIGSPEKVASDPIPGRSWRPAVRKQYARKAAAARFRTAAPGVLLSWNRLNGGAMNELFNIEALADALSRKMLQNGHIERPRLLNLEQAAAYLGMTSDAVKSKAIQGQVPAVKVDKKWRFDRMDLDRWIEDHKRIA
jgi:excisionase family DNA binding protein